jgi:hypothetical protein
MQLAATAHRICLPIGVFPLTEGCPLLRSGKEAEFHFPAMEGKMIIQILTSKSWNDQVQVIHLYEGAEFANLRRRIVKDLGVDGEMARDLAEQLLSFDPGKHIEWTGGIATIHELEVA